MTSQETTEDRESTEDPTLVPNSRSESGDPLLKRLVVLARLGWEADLVLFSNGAVITGSLISGAKFRAALAEGIRSRPSDLGRAATSTRSSLRPSLLKTCPLCRTRSQIFRSHGSFTWRTSTCSA